MVENNSRNSTINGVHWSDHYEQLLQEPEAKYREAKSSLKTEITQKKVAKKAYESAVEARSHIQTVAQAVQDQAHRQIASVVTRCLKAVFTDGPDFRIRFDRKRGKTEARLSFRFGKRESDSVLDSESGGMIDLASFALRLARTLIGDNRKVLILDEPWKHLHGDGNRRRAVQLLEALSNELKVQFLITTGTDWLRIGKVINMETQQ